MELSNNELLILNFLWDQNEPQGFSNILSNYNSITNKNWKKQTMHTYLTRLEKLDVIGIDDSKRRLRYYPKMTRDEYYQTMASDLIKESFNGSLSLFISAFTGRNKISNMEKQQLLDYLKEL